ncbi:MAG: hypothetical protein EXQ91_03120 [Alphaproteobacteria bacterium]|nr:hypothetical protein [Alphaproteobacteria bacterium]
MLYQAELRPDRLEVRLAALSLSTPRKATQQANRGALEAAMQASYKCRYTRELGIAQFAGGDCVRQSVGCRFSSVGTFSVPLRAFLPYFSMLRSLPRKNW